MKVREIMTPDPEVVTPDHLVSDAAKLMAYLDVGIVPVVDDEGSRLLKGVITDRDIAVRHVAERHEEDCPVSDHMSEATVTVGPEDDVHDVLRQMREARVRRVPVVDGPGKIVGIVAQADLAVKLGPSEPEVVEETIERISEPAAPDR